MMRFVVFGKERTVLEDVCIQLAVIGRVVWQQRAAKTDQFDVETEFLFGDFFATSATSCSAPLITPTLMCLASLLL